MELRPQIWRFSLPSLTGARYRLGVSYTALARKTREKVKEFHEQLPRLRSAMGFSWRVGVARFLEQVDLPECWQVQQ